MVVNVNWVMEDAQCMSVLFKYCLIIGSFVHIDNPSTHTKNL